MYEFLKPILGDDLFSQFEEKMSTATGVVLANIADGSHIPKSKFDDVNGKLRTANQSIATLNAQLSEARSKSDNVDELNGKVTKLTSDLADRDNQIAQIGLRYRSKDELRSMGVRNPDMLLNMLDMSKVSEQDGKLVGLTEQVEPYRKTDAYLFNNAPSSRGGFGGSVEQRQEVSTVDANAAIRMAAGRQ